MRGLQGRTKEGAQRREVLKVSKVKCDWDCCKHHDVETGYCENPGEIVLPTVEAKVGMQNKLELFDCKSFESFEEGES